THVAGDTLDPSLLVAIEAVDAAVVSRQLRLFLGKLLRDVLADERSAEVLGRRGDAGNDRRQVEIFEKIELRLLDPLHILCGNRHGSSDSQSCFGWHALKYSEGRAVLAKSSRPSEYLRACHPPRFSPAVALAAETPPPSPPPAAKG